MFSLFFLNEHRWVALEGRSKAVVESCTLRTMSSLTESKESIAQDSKPLESTNDCLVHWSSTFTKHVHFISCNDFPEWFEQHLLEKYQRELSSVLVAVRPLLWLYRDVSLCIRRILCQVFTLTLSSAVTSVCGLFLRLGACPLSVASNCLFGVFSKAFSTNRLQNLPMKFHIQSYVSKFRG